MKLITNLEFSLGIGFFDGHLMTCLLGVAWPRLTTRNAKSDVETIDWPYWFPHYVDPSYYKITKDGASTSLKMVTRCIEIPHFNIVFICAWSIFASFVIASTVFDWSNYNIVNLVVMILSQPCPMKLSGMSYT